MAGEEMTVGARSHDTLRVFRIALPRKTSNKLRDLFDTKFEFEDNVFSCTLFPDMFFSVIRP